RFPVTANKMSSSPVTSQSLKEWDEAREHRSEAREQIFKMSETTNNGGVEAAVSAANAGSTAVADNASAAEHPREKLTKKAITADHPTWCPGCGDFAVLASFYKVLEKKNLDHEKIVTLAGIGCSSRFPYFVNGHGAHFIHGRAVPLASGISLARPDLNAFMSSADGHGYSTVGNHLNHG